MDKAFECEEFLKDMETETQSLKAMEIKWGLNSSAYTRFRRALSDNGYKKKMHTKQ